MSRSAIADVTLGGEHYGIFYAPLGESVYSADRVQRCVAVFISRPIDATNNLLTWKTIGWDASRPESTRIYVYVRSARTISGLDSQEWQGPLLNPAGEDIRSQTGRYIQIALSIYSHYDTNSEVMETPVVRLISASCYMTGSESKFYTQKFDLGFKPKHILLTYNGTISDDTLVQFAVAGRDSTDSEEYQIITPNSIQALDQISQLSDGLKVMVRGLGSSEVPFTIDEFSVAVSGDGQTKVNKT